jgi:hypothetical protein
MPILRIHRKSKFTVVPNEIIRNAELSLQAKMILVTYLSNADGVEVSNEYLETTCKNGRESIRSAVNELIVAGYYKRERYCTPEDGRWYMRITVTTEPWQFGEPPGDGNPTYGNPSVGDATVGAPSDKSRKTREKDVSYESADAESEHAQRVIPIGRQRRPRSGQRRVEVLENSPTETAGRTIGIPHATDRSRRIANERAAIARPDSGGGLAKHFGILASQAGLAGPQQVNGAALAKNLTAWMSDGQNPDTPEAIRAMMDQFFATPKPRSDRPLWRRFLTEAPQLRAAHAKAQPIDYRAAEARDLEQARIDAARGDIRAQKLIDGEDKPWRTWQRQQARA